jgi:hypothetical protein
MIQPIERNTTTDQRISFRYDHFTGGLSFFDRRD